MERSRARVRTPVQVIALWVLAVLCTALQAEQGANRLAAAPPTHEMTFQQGVDGYDGGQDTSIWASNPTGVYHPPERYKMRLQAPDQAAILIGFELDDIAEPISVTAAYLEIYIMEHYWATPVAVGAYRVNSPWRYRETSWLEAAKGAPWEMPGCNAVPSDRDGEPECIVELLDRHRHYRFPIAEMAQEWLRDPSTNHGVVLKSFQETGDIWLAANEHGAELARPKLIIQYATAPSPTPSPTATATATRSPTATATRPPSRIQLPLLRK